MRASTRSFIASSVFVLLLTAMPAAQAGHEAVNSSPGGAYEGYATGSTLHVDAATMGATRVADLEVGVTNASVNSEGLRERLSTYDRTIEPAEPENHANARSSILEAGVLLSPPQAPNQISPFVTEVSAPPSGSLSKSLLNTSVGPVAHADLLRNEAAAVWNANTCVVGEPISRAEQHAARIEVLETKDDPSTDAASGYDAALVGVDANRAGPPRALTHTISAEQLYASGDAFGLQSAATTTLAPVTFFEGTPNEFTIEVDGPSSLAARANGRSGGAELVYSVPLVSLIQGGVSRTVLPGAPITIRVPGTGDVLAKIEVGVLQSRTVRADGTTASGVANVVEVTILDTASPDLTGVTIALGHMEVYSHVPAGGIQCPIPVTKVADPPSVPVGDTFETTITVTNPFNCPLTNVRLVDVISVDGAVRFEVVSAPGSSSFSDGAGRSTGSASWNLGTIAPKSSKSVVITLEAQEGAGRILDTASATGTLLNCEAKPASGSAGTDITAMASVNVPVDGSTSIVETVTRTSVLASTTSGRLPKTGVEDHAPMAALLLALAAGLAALLRRRPA